jgi:hypothetical protein
LESRYDTNPHHARELLLTASSLTELFLPSYADYDSHDLEHKQDPVHEVILTDEEAAALLPQ